MSPEFLERYEAELRFLRGEAALFAKREAKIAARLGISKDICRDPFVERLLEGSAFLAARVVQKLDAEYPRLLEGVFETVFPQFLCPVPSMAVVRFEAAPDCPPTGTLLHRDTVLRTAPAAASALHGRNTTCTFSTGTEVRLLPLQVTEVKYYSTTLESVGLPDSWEARSCLRITMETTGAAPLEKVAYDALTFFLASDCPERALLFEALCTSVRGIAVKPVADGRPLALDHACLEPVGLDLEDRLLPEVPHRFDGYRLLREYFAFPDRFLFVRARGLKPAVKAEYAITELLKEAVEKSPNSRRLEIYIGLGTDVPRFEKLRAQHLLLHCAPAVNLFKKIDIPSIQVENRFSEFRVRTDDDRDEDFEIFELTEVFAKDEDLQDIGRVEPLFAVRKDEKDALACYSLHRVARSARRDAPGEAGADVYLRLSGPALAARRPPHLLLLTGQCTNRDLPSTLVMNSSTGDFQVMGEHVKAIWFVVRPTEPIPSPVSGSLGWKLISHLSLNYLSLVGAGPGANTPDARMPLRELMALYLRPSPRADLFLDALRDVHHRPVQRFVPGLFDEREVPVMSRGLEVTVTLDEATFAGTGAFLFGSVLNRFFQGYVALNSFVELVLRTTERNEVYRWRLNPGLKPII